MVCHEWRAPYQAMHLQPGNCEFSSCELRASESVRPRNREVKGAAVDRELTTVHERR